MKTTPKIKPLGTPRTHRHCAIKANGCCYWESAMSWERWTPWVSWSILENKQLPVWGVPRLPCWCCIVFICYWPTFLFLVSSLAWPWGSWFVTTCLWTVSSNRQWCPLLFRVGSLCLHLSHANVLAQWVGKIAGSLLYIQFYIISQFEKCWEEALSCRDSKDMPASTLLLKGTRFQWFRNGIKSKAVAILLLWGSPFPHLEMGGRRSLLLRQDHHGSWLQDRWWEKASKGGTTRAKCCIDSKMRRPWRNLVCLASLIKAKFNFQLSVYLKAAWRATRRREGPLTTETKNKGAF